MELCVASLELFLSHPTKTALGGAASELLPLARIKAEKVGQPAQPLVFQPALHQLAGLLIQHGHLLVACMQITTYNLHVLGSFSSEPWCFEQYQVYSASRSRHRYLISSILQVGNRFAIHDAYVI